MNQRIIMPEDFPKDAVVIHTIHDLQQINKYPLSETPLHLKINDFCQGWGLHWWERGQELSQVFSYRGATMSEMENLPGPDEGGYEYIVFRTNTMPHGIQLITDGMTPTSPSINATILGWGHHSSRYFFESQREACYGAYREAHKEAEKISQRTGLGLAQMIDRYIRFGLDCERKDRPNFELQPFDLRHPKIEQK
jgi:hypothetical protein